MSTKTPTSYNIVSVPAGGRASSSGTLGTPLDGSHAFTVETWVRPHGLGSRLSFLARQGQFFLGAVDTNIIVQIEGGASLATPWPEDPASTEWWHHIAAVYDGTEMKLYVDGDLATRAIIRVTPQSSDQPYVMGDGMAGDLYCVRIHDSALTDKQVKAQMYDPPDDMSYVADFNFGVNPARDTSGNDLPLTLANGARSRGVTPSVRMADIAYCQPVRDAAVNPGGGGTDSFSVQGWVYALYPPQTPDVNAREMMVMNAGYDDNTGMALFLTYDTSRQAFKVKTFRGNAKSQPVLESKAYVSLKTWVNLAVTYDGTTLKLYIDGTLDNSVANGAVETQDAGQMMLGAGLVAGRPSGDMTLQGYISRIEVWNKALTADEVGTYTHTLPVMEEGCIARYDFFAPPARNEVNGNPIGLTDGARLTEQIGAPIPDGGEARIAGAAPRAHEPLDAETMQALRAEALATHAEHAQHVVEGLKAARAHDLDPANYRRFIPPEAEADYVRKATANWDDVIAKVEQNPMQLDPMVRLHRVGDDWVIAQHALDGSTVLYRAPADLFDACTMWRITMIWTVVAGMLSILGVTAVISDKVKDFVVNRVLANRQVMNAINGAIGQPGATALGVFTVLRTLHAFGLLWPLVKMALVSAGWWTLGRLLVKIIACFTGLEAAEFIANLIVVAGQIGVAIAQQPDDCPLVPSSGDQLPQGGMAPA